jgi:hypothetical protein
VTHYDFLAGTFDQIDPDLVRATRSPWMGSRISAKEAAWLIDHGTTAPWAAVPLDAQLKDADPRAIDGLYDRAAALWEHFWDARPGGVSTAKISKTLYLMRPGLFPILDSYLTMFYRTAARAAAVDVGQQRPALAPFRTLYWEAVRRTSSTTKPPCAHFDGCSLRQPRHWRSRRLKDSVTCGFLTCLPSPHRQGKLAAGR